jgi:predicted DNA binding CopG/RHH family protein
MKTTEIKARIEFDDRLKFKRHAAALHLTESALLRRLVLQAIDADSLNQLPEKTNSGHKVQKRMTIRLSSEAVNQAKIKAKARGMNPSTWVAALVKSNLSDTPVINDSEVSTLRESNRELAAVGRNLNQITKALNDAFHETDRLKLDAIKQLQITIMQNRKDLMALVASSNRYWQSNI